MTIELIVSASLVWLGIVTYRAASDAHIAQVSAAVNCNAGNMRASANKKLWDGVLVLLNPSGGTTGTTPIAIFVRTVEKEVNQAFAQHECPKP